MARHAAAHRAARIRGTRAGRENILARMSELMFVETIRRYIETLPPARSAGWPACGIRSSGRHWPCSTASLPSRGRSNRWREPSALSRSVLADRFAEMVGHPPMQYLALWRMQLASRRLAEGGQWRRWPLPSATNRKRRSAGPSRSWLVTHRRPGAGPTCRASTTPPDGRPRACAMPGRRSRCSVADLARPWTPRLCRHRSGTCPHPPAPVRMRS